MADEWMDTDEQVSALVDGQLRGAALDRTLDYLQSSSRARAAWAHYHIVGEALRSGQAHAGAQDAELFVQRLRLRLVQRAPAVIAADAVAVAPAAQTFARLTSANDGWWRRVAGLASLAVVGIVAWQGLEYPDPGAAGLAGAAPPTAQTAAMPQDAQPVLSLASLEHEPVFAATQPVMLRDPRLDALLAAHRQFGATLAPQTPSGFLRNATFEEGRP